MAFIKFSKPGRSFKPRVSISSRGLMSFSNGARKRFKMDEYGWCSLYYDSEIGMVGIELLSDNKSEEAIRLRIRSTGADISASSFLSFFNIEVKDTMMYEISKNEENGWLVFDLKSGIKRNTTKKENMGRDGS